jgi:hypothetical protein
VEEEEKKKKKKKKKKKRWASDFNHFETEYLRHLLQTGKQLYTPVLIIHETENGILTPNKPLYEW